MVKYIKCGKYNIHYKYILLSTLFCFLSTIILGYGYCNDSNLLKIPRTDGQNLLYLHKIIHNIYLNIGIVIISLILYNYEKFTFKNDKKKEKVNNTGIQLIHEDTEKKLEKKSLLNIILVIILYIIQDILTILFFQNDFRPLNFWILELPILSYFNFKLLKVKIYSHHKFVILLSVIVCLTTKIIIIIMFSLPDEKVYLAYPIYQYIYLIPVGIIYYLVIIIIRAYAVTEMKIFMDLRYISPTKLLIIYGIIGFLINSIICIIFTYNKCFTISDIDIHLCQINNISNNSEPNETYLENFFIYFKVLKDSINNNKNSEVIIEVFVSFIGAITYFCYIYFYILIIQFLTSVHIIFFSLIYAFAVRICAIICNLAFDIDHPFKKKELNIKFILEFIFTGINDIIAGLSIFIYLEVIELNFYNFSYNLRRNIMKRSEEDLVGNEKFGKIDYLNNEENDEERESSNCFRHSNCSELSVNNKANNK